MAAVVRQLPTALSSSQEACGDVLGSICFPFISPQAAPSRPLPVYWSPVPTILQPTMGSNTFCYSLQHIGSWGDLRRGVSQVLALHHGVGGGSLRSCLSWALPPPPHTHTPASRKGIDFHLGCPTPVWESYHCHSTCQLPSGHGEASPRTPFSVTIIVQHSTFPRVLLPSEHRCLVSGSRELTVSSAFLFLRSGPQPWGPSDETLSLSLFAFSRVIPSEKVENSSCRKSS